MAAQQVPVTMLSGFLGAGKTTLLRYLLENTSLKIGCIINDVASVNIDAKLIRNDRNRDRSGGINTTSDLADTIELANGCACAPPGLSCFHADVVRLRCRHCVNAKHASCMERAQLSAPALDAGCSIQDELFASFEQLLALADRKGITYDRCARAQLCAIRQSACPCCIPKVAVVGCTSACTVAAGLCWRTRAWRSRRTSGTSSRRP